MIQHQRSQSPVDRQLGCVAGCRVGGIQVAVARPLAVVVLQPTKRPFNRILEEFD